VKSGDPYGQGQTYGGFAAPSVARVVAGFDVAFMAAINGVPSVNGIFVDRDVTSPSSLAPQTVFLEGTTVTVQGIGTNLLIGNVTQLPPPALGRGGHVAQTALLSGGGLAANTSALLLRAPGALSPLIGVCFKGKLVQPGISTDTYNLVAIPFALTEIGEVGFRASITSSVGGDAALVFSDSAQNLQIVARKNDPAPGTVDLYNQIADGTNGAYLARFDSTGRSAFRATTSGASIQGIWVDDAGPDESLVADTQLTAPGFEPLEFQEFKSPAVTSGGIVAFRACVDSACNLDGIWRDDGTSLTLVAKDDAEAPDAFGDPVSTDKFNSFSNPAVGLSAAIAFRAVLKASSGAPPEGIWRWRPYAGLRRIVKSGDSLRGTSLTFVSFEEVVAVADSGEVAFEATMSDGKDGLFVTSDLGWIVKIAKVGEAFPVGGVNKNISIVNWVAGSTAQGNGGFVQDLAPVHQVAAIAYGLRFEDMTSAVVLTTLE
jgi:hypothetical protein